MESPLHRLTSFHPPPFPVLATMGLVMAVALALTTATDSPATQAQVAQARASGSILFSGGPGGLEDKDASRFFAIDAGGGKLKEVLVDAVEAHWSPDGRRLAFIRRRARYDLPDKLFVVRADGSGTKLLTQLREGSLAPTFSWSPSGARIVYSNDSAQATEEDGLYAIGADGRNRLRLGSGVNPIWSPDGRRVAFLKSDSSLGSQSHIRRSLWIMSADGSQQRQLTRGLEANALSLQSWAPDSTRLAFDSSGEKGIWIVDVDDFRVQSRRPGESLVAPSWSPNGRWIAVNTFSDTLVMKPNGKLVRRWSGIDGGLRAPSWSPDSRAVAVASDAKDDTVRDIWVGALASGPARRITSGWRYGYSSWAPEWNPAGFATSRLGGRSVEHSIPTDSITESAMSLATTRPVQRLVADGSAVAIGYQRPAPNQGSTVSEIWRPQLRSVVRFRINGSIGFAGERIVWMLGPSPGGGVDFWNVYTATLSEPRIRRYDDTSAWQITRPLSDPVGDSALLTLSSWGPCRISMNPPCAREPKRNGELYLLGAERDDAPYLNGVKTTRIASNSGLLTAIGVDAERILVDHEDGTYELRRSDGSVIRTFRLNAVVVRVVKLQGRELVVRTTSAVEVTNAENGEFLGRWPLPSTDARLEDVQDGIAVFLDGRTITLLRLSDGRTKEIDVPGIGQTLAQLEPSGLFYAYRVDDPKHQGRVRFMPFAQIELAQG